MIYHQTQLRCTSCYKDCSGSEHVHMYNEVIQICNSCSQSWELYYWNLLYILQSEELMSLCIIWELIHIGIV